MTSHDLSVLLQADVSASEPPDGPDPAMPIRLGRRRLRARMALGGGALVAVVAATSVAPFVLLDPHQRDRPAESESYDAEEMPRILDAHVRAVLDRDVRSLGPVTFSAQGQQSVDELPPGRYDEAVLMRVTYGRVTHRYEVTVLHAGSEAEGPMRRICRREEASHLAFGCFVAREDEMFVVTTVRAYQPMGANPLNDRGYQLVRTSDLSSVPPGRRWFARTVKVIKSDTLLTYVTERVRATSLLDANRSWNVSVSDMVEIGTDPALVIPDPGRSH
jgi:hypothetical protein